MGSLNPNSETKQEFDDSGYVQEDNKESVQQSTSDGYRGVTELLDLSDDVLLYILRHCSPMDLKALGFTCNRLAALVLDRTLWQRVDARDRPCGPRRVRWFMAHGIGYNTTSIMFSGYARDTTGSSEQIENKNKIDVGASGDGPSLNQASTSQASTSQASTSQASTSQASTSQASTSQAPRKQFSAAQASNTDALAQAIISQLQKSKDSANQASNSANQDNSPSYHIIEASPRHDYTNNSANQAPVEQGQIHIIEANPLQGNFTSRVHIINATTRENSNNQEGTNDQAENSKMDVENQVSASLAPKTCAENQVNASQSQMEEDTDNGMEESKTDAENQVSSSRVSKTDAENQVSSSRVSKTDAEINFFVRRMFKINAEDEAYKKEGPSSSKEDTSVTASTSKVSASEVSDSVSACQASGSVYAIQASDSVSVSKASDAVSTSQASSSVSANQASGSVSASQVSAEEGPKPPANHIANGVVPPRRPSNHEEEIVLPPRLYRLTSQSMPRYGNQIPYWPEGLLRSSHPTSPSPKLTRSAPQVTMTATALGHLGGLCPKLEELALEYCVIDCATVNLGMFPNYLKKLSFRGSKCYNMEKSFLFKIQDYLPELEVLDLSYCEWVEPSCMLPLSKLQNLHTLYMRECPKLSEFVAYASLATRYGFKALKVLDLRGSPVGDSEVAALGWLPRLEQLLLSRAEPCAKLAPAVHHRHELEPWEEDEPEFFRNKRHNHPWLYDDPIYKTKNCKTEPLKPRDECVLLERMVAEPVAPEEYSSVYQRFFPPPNLAKPSTSLPKPGTSSPKDGTSSPVASQDDYKDYSSILAKNPEASAVVISNNRTYSIVRNEDENSNDPNGQAVRIIHCRPGRSNDDEKPGPSKISDENGDEGPTSAKKMKIGDSPGPSKSSENTITSSTKTNNDDKNNDQSDSDDDDDGPKIKRQCQKAPDNAPTSSKKHDNPEKNDSQPSSSNCQNPEATSNESKTQRYVRFRQYQPPIVIEEFGNNDNNNDDQNNDDTNDNREPKHRILFVNVGRRRHAMYQLSMPVCTVAEPVDLRTNNVVPNSRNVSSLIYASPVSSRLDHGALVTDSAIRRFGRADGENISYVHIGPNGPIPAPFDDPNARPNRSNLRVLSATGFRYITNTSLVHLATAAPHLRFVDFTGTSVTRAGVEQFKSLRPDCKVRFSVHEKIDKPT